MGSLGGYATNFAEGYRLAQSQPPRGEPGGRLGPVIACRSCAEEPDHRHRLLRVPRERPRGGRASQDVGQNVMEDWLN
jgi:hypothetical protein